MFEGFPCAWVICLGDDTLHASCNRSAGFRPWTHSAGFYPNLAIAKNTSSELLVQIPKPFFASPLLFTTWDFEPRVLFGKTAQSSQGACASNSEQRHQAIHAGPHESRWSLALFLETLRRSSPWNVPPYLGSQEQTDHVYALVCLWR